MGEWDWKYFVGLQRFTAEFMVASNGEGEAGAEVITTWFPRRHGLPLEQSDITIRQNSPSHNCSIGSQLAMPISL